MVRKVNRRAVDAPRQFALQTKSVPDQLPFLDARAWYMASDGNGLGLRAQTGKPAILYE
jgi:hypothetical protein